MSDASEKDIVMSEDQEEDFPSETKSDEQKRLRSKWGMVETADLVDGCYEYGVGAWTKILNDPKYHFRNRTAVDLKDRFRTIYPQEYKRLYPESQRIHQPKKPIEIQPPHFERVKRRKRRPFTKEEDEQLWRGVKKHGVAWSRITKDFEFDLAHRQSTDLRDRFRNAFPDEYAALGYTERPRRTKKRATTRSPTVDQESSEDALLADPTSARVTDENEQVAFWANTSSPLPSRQDERYETSLPRSHGIDFSSSPKRSLGGSDLSTSPSVNKITGAKIDKNGQIQYRIKFGHRWAKEDELPPSAQTPLSEFVNIIQESVAGSPRQEKRYS